MLNCRWLTGNTDLWGKEPRTIYLVQDVTLLTWKSILEKTRPQFYTKITVLRKVVV